MQKEMRTVSRQLLKQFLHMIVEPEKLSTTKFRVHIVPACLAGTSLSAHSLLSLSSNHPSGLSSSCVVIRLSSFLPIEMSKRPWTAYSVGTPLTAIPQHWDHELMLELALQEYHRTGL